MTDQAVPEELLTVQLLGVRGSTAAPGRPFVQVGGHTSCLAVLPRTHGGRWLVLDAGTGFRHLSGSLGDQPLHADVVLTHLHWDHVQGLPFLAQADREDAAVTLWIPSPDRDDAAALERLAEGFSPPSFPIRPDQLRGDWQFRALVAGEQVLTDRTVSVVEVRHKGGLTMGVRVSTPGRSFAYLPDHGVSIATERERQDADRLVAGVDVLFHGGPYLGSEQATATAFGHSTVAEAVDVAVRNEVGRLVLVHHASTRTDDQIHLALAEAEQRVRQLDAELSVRIGRELDLVHI